MTPDVLTRGLVGAAPLVIGGVSLGLLAAAVSGGLLIVGKRVPAIATAGAAGIPTLILALVAWSGASAGGEAGLARAIAAGLVAPILVGLPAALVLFLTAAAGVKHEPRRWAGAAAGMALILGIAAVLAAEGWWLDDTTLTGVRAAVYVGVGLLVALSLVAGGATGPEAAAGAGTAFACFVAAGESASQSLAEFLLCLNLGSRPVAHRAAIIDGFQATVIDAAAPYAWVVLALAAIVAIVGVARAAPDPRRLALSASALVWLVAAALLMTAAHPHRAAIAAYAAGLPEPPVTVVPATPMPSESPAPTP